MWKILLGYLMLIPAVSAATATAMYPDPWWGFFLVRLGMFVLLLYIGYLLVVSPVLSEQDMDQEKQHILSTLAILVVAVFTLTDGAQFVGRYAGVDGLYSTADNFTSKHLTYSAEAYLEVAGAYTVLRIAESVLAVGKIPGAVADMLGAIIERLQEVSEAVAIHKALLALGHRYVMNTIFPLGVLLLLVRPFRMAGAYLAAQAVALWLVLPAVIVAVYLPMEAVWGVGTPPTTAILTSIAHMNPFSMATLRYPSGPEWTGFIDWYIGEITLWLYAPIIGFLIVEGSVILLVMVVGGYRTIFMLRRIVRYITAISIP